MLALRPMASSEGFQVCESLVAIVIGRLQSLLRIEMSPELCNIGLVRKQHAGGSMSSPGSRKRERLNALFEAAFVAACCVDSTASEASHDEKTRASVREAFWMSTAEAQRVGAGTVCSHNVRK